MGVGMADDTEWTGDHYREMAVKLRDLARQTHFPSVRKALAGIAKRFDRIADRADRANSLHSPRTVDLPGKLPSNIKRWTSRRKAAVVTAVKSGVISREEVCSIYQLSEEELIAWERVFEMHGQPGLRAMTLQYYRGPGSTRRGREPPCRTGGVGRPSNKR
jgi:hypothetical protein